MKPSSKIKNYLQKNGASSVLELSSALNLTKADIRYHLSGLIKTNEIRELAPVRNANKRGRPSSRFVIESNPSIEELEFLVNIIIEQINNSYSTHQIARLIFSRYIDKIDHSHPSFSKINQAINLLKNLGVTASWSAGKNGPQISIISNPYKKTDPQPYTLVMDQLIHLIEEYVSRI